MQNQYDDIVVGSGISGLTMALFLARSNRRVLLLEKAGQIGGSVARFRKNGIPFDVGFHFTGGMQDGGILHNILLLLGIRDRFQPVFFSNENAASFLFEDSGRNFEHPAGIDRIKKRFKDYVPGEVSAIDRYFDRVVSVCERTPSMNFQATITAPPTMDEDFVTLDDVLTDLTRNAALRGLLSGYTMLYGVRPNEVSFANHSRMCQSFYESIATLVDGGDAFVHAFRGALQEAGVEVRCKTFISELADIRDQRAGRFILNTGEEITAENCVLTIHPKDIAALIPREHASRAFFSRVASFEQSAGFFTVFATIADGREDPYPGQHIASLFPSTDCNLLLDPAYRGDPALVIIKTPDAAAAGKKSIHVLAPSFLEHDAAWKDTRVGRRPKEYYEEKERRTAAIVERIHRRLPGYQGRFTVVDSASVLTYRDYLHSPDGSAYGVKQKIGQYNVVGKLPVRNLYAAGQSAVLPGVIGAMMSSLIVGRTMVGKDQYAALVSQGLCS